MKIDIQDVWDHAYKTYEPLGDYCSRCNYGHYESNGPCSPGGWECVATEADQCLFYWEKMEESYAESE
jgi:hypothetical protein